MPCWTNVEDVGPTLYQYYLIVLCLLRCPEHVVLICHADGKNNPAITKPRSDLMLDQRLPHRPKIELLLSRGAIFRRREISYCNIPSFVFSATNTADQDTPDKVFCSNISCNTVNTSIYAGERNSRNQ